jgi:cyclase
LSPLEAARSINLGRFAHWHNPERLVGNLHRAYSELQGEEPGMALSLKPIMADMVAFNGGQLLRHQI